MACSQTYPLWIRVALRNIHDARRLRHHVRHAIHRVVGLDLRGAELGHVGHLVHLLGEGLLRQEHLGLLVRLCRLALLQQVLDLLLEQRVLLGSFLGLAACLLRLELLSEREARSAIMARSVAATVPRGDIEVYRGRGEGAGHTRAWNSTCISRACWRFDILICAGRIIAQADGISRRLRSLS